jgi:TolA-binding protein
VIQAWPPLLLLAALALVALGELVTNLAFAARPALRRALRLAPAALAIGYTGVALARVEPYPLDYFDEIVGGPSGVAARRLFEVPWWGEGTLAAVRGLNARAPEGARVHLALWPKHVIARLRDDLVRVDDPRAADYVLVSHLQYFAQAPAGCTLDASAQAEGAPLVDTFRCTPASPVQLGFAAMHDAKRVDEAVLAFQDALRIHPGDPAAVFGLGWAAQTKGDLGRAEALYTDGASGAARAGDAETEYYARFNLGTLYARKGDNVRAAEAYRGAVDSLARAPAKLPGKAWEAWLGLGRALAASGRTTDARAAFERALQDRPGEPSVVEALAKLAPSADR